MVAPDALFTPAVALPGYNSKTSFRATAQEKKNPFSPGLADFSAHLRARDAASPRWAANRRVTFVFSSFAIADGAASR
jgi:hypothetical protein